MAVTIPVTGGNPANGVGGPGTCRAKWLASYDGVAGTGIAVTLSNATIQAAFNDPDVPAELLSVLSAAYGSAAAAQAASVGGMRFDLFVRSTTSPIVGAGATVNIDGGGLLTIDVFMSGPGDAAQAGSAQIELAFNHSAVR